MAKLEWQDSYSVGVSDLDDDHKRLIDIINRVARAERDNEPVDWVLEELEDYARVHFAREEERMQAAGYPGFDAHVEKHREFVEWLRAVERTYKLSPETESYLADSVNAHLTDWLTRHILETDMAYKGKLG